MWVLLDSWRPMAALLVAMLVMLELGRAGDPTGSGRE
jgi:hypothetical protein